MVHYPCTFYVYDDHSLHPYSNVVEGFTLALVFSLFPSHMHLPPCFLLGVAATKASAGGGQGGVLPVQIDTVDPLACALPFFSANAHNFCRPPPAPIYGQQPYECASTLGDALARHGLFRVPLSHTIPTGLED